MREKKSTHELLENEELCECYAREYFSVFFFISLRRIYFCSFFLHDSTWTDCVSCGRKLKIHQLTILTNEMRCLEHEDFLIYPRGEKNFQHAITVRALTKN